MSETPRQDEPRARVTRMTFGTQCDMVMTLDDIRKAFAIPPEARIGVALLGRTVPAGTATFIEEPLEIRAHWIEYP